MDELLKMMNVKDDDSNYFFKAELVANALEVSLNSVYSSRENSRSQQKKINKAKKINQAFVTDKLDKLHAFDLVKMTLEDINNNSIQGNKDSIILALNGILKPSKKYKIMIEEIKKQG